MSDLSDHDIRPHDRKKIVVPPSKASLSEARQVFRLEGLSKRWAGEHGFILKVPMLTVRQGEKVALVGFSGCGKSTLLDLLAMVLRPDHGVKFLFSARQDEYLDVIKAWRHKDLNTLAHARMLHMGYVLQTGGLFLFVSVRVNIGLSGPALGLSVQGAVEAVAERLGVSRYL